jgi:hypothetical protein
VAIVLAFERTLPLRPHQGVDRQLSHRPIGVDTQAGLIFGKPMSEEPEQFNKIYALMKFERDDLIEWLNGYFGLDGSEGTYAHWLTRCKSSRGVGTMSIEDFEEFSEESITELADFILGKLRSYD